jgi:pimeloyl-ACP methyl ester carboxylesterase
MITVGSSRLEAWDSGTGPSLVFIHGVGTSGEMWRADLAGLADCRLIVYNRRGYGASSSSPRDWGAHGDDAVGLIENIGASPAIVVGYSGGAIVALDAVLKRPDLIARLVLLDPAVNLQRCLTPGLVGTLAAVKTLGWLRGERAAAARWLRYVSGYATGGCGFDALSDTRREQLLTNAAAIFADLASAGSTIDETVVGKIDVPVTIVDAALSTAFLRRSSLRLKQLLPRARTITLEHSGHWVGLDARDQLLAILRDAAH